ncbi:putative short chain dehydrogenase [Xylariaceae sp. FL0016]|nr:putative short chain dehydrogenase [Xylariaceae sp. FL0016]
MARIFITGSADGLGQRAARALISRGHDVYLHARSPARAQEAMDACPGAKDAFVADLSSVQETKELAQKLRDVAPSWDAVVHNAGVVHGVQGTTGKEGIPTLFAVNTLAPYVVTALLGNRSARYVFLGSGAHVAGDATLQDIQKCDYSDSKLHNILLAFWFGRHFKSRGEKVDCSAMDPGRVPTKMGGWDAPDNIDKATDTYVMLAEGSGAAKGKEGGYWYQCSARAHMREVGDKAVQDKLVKQLEEISGTKMSD